MKKILLVGLMMALLPVFSVTAFSDDEHPRNGTRQKSFMGMKDLRKKTIPEVWQTIEKTLSDLTYAVREKDKKAAQKYMVKLKRALNLLKQKEHRAGRAKAKAKAKVKGKVEVEVEAGESDDDHEDKNEDADEGKGKGKNRGKKGA